jgi:hypothetical protein
LAYADDVNKLKESIYRKENIEALLDGSKEVVLYHVTKV